ncbi:hypothetical protein K438DRAFT_1764464 [Mycena galopus ATCC 62051]|nr:hypothetical protein K438DRAFT_1764464 [Mycena galopus ATCC 62051]
MSFFQGSSKSLTTASENLSTTQLLYFACMASTSRRMPTVAPLPTKAANGSGNPRDFITKMKEGKKRIVIFYGLQTGTAEEYAICLASLVCDPEEYDFENLAQTTKMGGIRIGERGEKDNDKSMEEDYLEWMDGIELSARALMKMKGIHDAKNPYSAPISASREFFQSTQERNCVHVELNTNGSGITYQHGDHVGIWPSNPEAEVNRLLCALGLLDKNPSTPLVPKFLSFFPVPTTYATILRYYIDISAIVGRQILSSLSKFAPTPEAEEVMKTLNSSKEEYFAAIFNGCFKVGEVFQLAAGNEFTATPTAENTTAWSIPFDTIVSAIPVSNRVTTLSPRARSSIPPPSTSLPLYLNTSPSPALIYNPNGCLALGVAPFRGFVQECIALARRWIKKNGPDALADWGRISLFDGCRKSTQDFLYKEEWRHYSEELKGKFSMHCTFSREPP